FTPQIAHRARAAHGRCAEDNRHFVFAFAGQLEEFAQGHPVFRRSVSSRSSASRSNILMHSCLPTPFFSARVSTLLRWLFAIRSRITRVSRASASGPPRCAAPSLIASTKFCSQQIAVLIPPLRFFRFRCKLRHDRFLHNPTFALRYEPEPSAKCGAGSQP